MASKSIVRLLQNQINKLGFNSIPQSLRTTSRNYASWEPEDKVTHTGQVLTSKSDMIRFLLEVTSVISCDSLIVLLTVIFT